MYHIHTYVTAYIHVRVLIILPEEAAAPSPVPKEIPVAFN